MWAYLFSFLNPQEKWHSPPLETQLIGSRVLLRLGDPADWRPWRALREISRKFLMPWEPTWPGNALNYEFFCSLLRRYAREWRQGKAYSFLIFARSEEGQVGQLIGGIALNDVQRGVAQKGTLGYWVGEPYTGKGYMTEAANLVCDFAFNTLRLHRVEASCLPRNEPSKALLKRLGFEEEGYAKSYLQINGVWEDHLLWGRRKPHSNRPDTQTATSTSAKTG